MPQHEQPDHATKLLRLGGEEVGWDYAFKAPPVCTAFWDHEDWIKFIGDKWFRWPVSAVQGTAQPVAMSKMGG